MPRPSTSPPKPQWTGYVLFVLSGFTGLVLEVLWLKQAAQLFGSTSQATGITLALFFAGLAVGARIFDGRSQQTQRPLRAYGLLELGVAASAAVWFGLFKLYHAAYPVLFAPAEGMPVVALLLKALLSATLIVPPAVFMGGTFPMLARWATLRCGRKEARPTAVIGRLYALNTVGAATGAMSGAFLLHPLLGYSGAYALAIGINVVIAAVAFGADRPPIVEPGQQAERTTRASSGWSPWMRVVAFGSGALTLGSQVAWTRMFSQVLLNCVYSFSIVLVTYLSALALGAWLAARGPVPQDMRRRVGALLAASAVALCASAWLFDVLTSGMAPLVTDGSWGWYVFVAFGLSVAVTFVPATLMGTVFPTLLRAATAVGTPVATNTAGAIAGSFGVGVLLFAVAGVWQTFALLISAYAALALLSFVGAHGYRLKVVHLAPALVLLAAAAWLPIALPEVRVAADEGESLVELLPGSHGTVSVVKVRAPADAPAYGDDLLIRLNNTYTLGGLGALADQRRQAHLPLALHPAPKSVFFLGVATGISAGAALLHPVERVVSCELIPEVVDAARTHFSEHASGLFTDPRSKIVIDDGRSYLLGTKDSFDVVIADLFIPWTAGTGSLYSREHFESVKARLMPGGLFAQWLPLYQLTEVELGIIVRTFLEVFPQATLWRGNFHAEKPTAVLIGHSEATHLDPKQLATGLNMLTGTRVGRDALFDALLSVKGVPMKVVGEQERAELDRRIPMLLERLPFTFYASNLTATRHLFDGYPINTDDRPIIEFVAPQVVNTGGRRWLIGNDLARFYERLAAALPPDQDPYLKNLAPAQHRAVGSGVSHYRAQVFFHRAATSSDHDAMTQGQHWFKQYLQHAGLVAEAQ